VASQLQEISLPNLTRAITLQDLPQLTVLDHSFILESWLHRQRSRKAWVHLHGYPLIEIKHEKEDQTYWLCKYCETKRSGYLFKLTATTSIQEHRRKQHSITKKHDENDTSSSSFPSVMEQQQRDKNDRQEGLKGEIITLT
jgi:hypothetical protein